MTTPTQFALPAAPHHNQQLFSDHYLNVILPERSDWKQLIPAAQSAMTQIAAIYDRYTPSENEAQTERDLIQPLLNILGHPFEVQPALRTPDGAKRPDYVCFNDHAAVAAHKNQTFTDDFVRSSVTDSDCHLQPALDASARVIGGPTFTQKV